MGNKASEIITAAIVGLMVAAAHGTIPTPTCLRAYSDYTGLAYYFIAVATLHFFTVKTGAQTVQDAGVAPVAATEEVINS